jgi:regulator of protease activity HflC (stomatin/prohibitin superfamily)
MDEIWLLLPLVVIGIGFMLWRKLSVVTVYEYQKGLFYKNGKLDRIVDAGTYRFFASNNKIEVVDTRKRELLISGQEMLTRDNIGIRVSAVGSIHVADPVKAIHQSEHYLGDIYTVGQLALRDAIGTVTLDELLNNKIQFDLGIQEKIARAAIELGAVVSGVAIRDIMLPANLKKAYSGVLEAQKEAQKNLEKARGEQAVLRSLANSAKMYDEMPALLQARVIQALATGNNSIVFGAGKDQETGLRLAKK